MNKKVFWIETMNLDAKQEKVSVETSDNILNDPKLWKDDLIKLARVIGELNKDDFFASLPVSKRNSLRKCLDETESIIAEVGTVADCVETKQEEQVLNKSVTELTSSVTALVNYLATIKSNNDRGRRIFLIVVSFLSFLVFVEAIIWGMLYTFWGASIHSPQFALFSLGLLPQIAIVDIALLWLMVKHIIGQWSRMSYRRKHV